MESNEGTLFLTAFEVETQTLVFPIILTTLDANFGDLKKQLGHVTACQEPSELKHTGYCLYCSQSFLLYIIYRVYTTTYKPFL